MGSHEARMGKQGVHTDFCWGTAWKMAAWKTENELGW